MIDISNAMKKPLIVMGILFGAIIGMGLLAGFSGVFFSNTKAITQNITTADVGNAQANSIIHGFGFFVPVVIVLGFIGLVFVVVQYKTKG